MRKQNQEEVVLKSLADLFRRDAVEIATDPKYMKPEGGPLPIVGKLLDAAEECEQ